MLLGIDLKEHHYWLAGVAIVQILVFLFFFLRIYFKGKRGPNISSNQSLPGVSIIMATRNQVDLLKENLPELLNLDYPEYQIIVVNDGSWDETEDYLKELELRHNNLKQVLLKIDDRYHKGKKFAITLGIKAAKYDWLLFTDTDCRPRSKQWIKSMMSARKPETEIVLGYSPYNASMSLLNAFVRYETFLTAQQYLSMALAGIPYMGVGRNLLYKKELFFRFKGFASHQHILSGDDDLFVNETSNKFNTEVCIHSNAFVYSVPKNTLNSWVKQKGRHLSAGKYYKWKDQLILGFWSALQLSFYLLLIVSLVINPASWTVLLLIYGIRMLIQMLVYGLNMHQLKVLPLLPLVPILDPGMLLYYFTIGLDGLFSNPRSWNG